MSEMGSERTANVVLTADVDQYRTSIQAASVETGTLTARLDDLTRSLDSLAKSAGNKLQILGVGSIAGVTGATAAYAVLEKQMSSLHAQAAVTGRSFETMSRSVNNLRREFPLATSEAAAMVSVVSKMADGTTTIDHLAKSFTKLGGATGESTLALTQGMLQLQRQMGTTQRDTERFNNTLTVLSQKNGVSAQGILEFSQAIAPMAKVAGMSQQAVMGISTAFAKAGQDGFLATNAFNRMITDVMQSVTSGSPGLAKYANLIGVTVEQFRGMDKTKAITDIFSELNRLGPNAIGVLNRMGLDGMRTIKAITGVSQQSGGIGKAVAEAMGAYNQGNNQNSALNRGSTAAFDGLIDQMVKLKNTVAQIGEALGKATAPIAEGFVKGINGMNKALASFLNGPAGQLLSWFGAVGGIGATAVGTIMQFAAPLATAAAGMLLLRNNFTAGVSRSFQLRRGATDDNLRGFAARYYARNGADGSGARNPMARWLWNSGNQVGMAQTAAGRFLLPVSQPGGPGYFSRTMGVVPGAAAAFMRFMAMGYDPLRPANISDPSRRMAFMQGSTWREVGRNMFGGGPAPAPGMSGIAGQMARSGIGGIMGQSGAWNQARTAMGQLLMSNRTLAGLTGQAYSPLPPRNVGSLTGGTPLNAGFAQNVNSLVRSLGLFSMRLTQAGVGLSALTVRTAALGATMGVMRGLGSLGGGALNMVKGLGPLGIGMLGFGAYAAMKGKSEVEYDPEKLSMMDVYAKSVGDATSATVDFTSAMRKAIDALPQPKSRQEELKVTAREARLAGSSNYEYTAPEMKDMGQKMVQAQLNSKLADPNTSAPMIRSIKLDLIKRFGPEQAEKMLAIANRSGGSIDLGGVMNEMFSKYSARAELPLFRGDFDKDMQSSFNGLSTLLDDRESFAFSKGEVPAARQRRRSDLVSILDWMSPRVGQEDFLGIGDPNGTGRNTQPNLLNPGLVNWGELKKFESWFDKRYLDGKGEVGSLPGQVDLKHAMLSGDSGDMLKSIASQLLETKTKEDERVFARGTLGISVRQMKDLVSGEAIQALGPGTGVGSTAMTWDSLAAQGGAMGDELVSKLYTTTISPEERFRAKWGSTRIGKMISGDPLIEKAILPENVENANVQIAAVDQFVAKLQSTDLSFAEMNKALLNFQAVIGDSGEPLYILAEAARNAANQLAGIQMAFMGPGRRYAEQGRIFQGVLDANPGQDEESMAKKDKARQEFISQSMEAINWVKSAYIQTREFQIGMEQSLEDFNLQRRRGENEFDRQRRRAQDSFNRQRKYQEEDFNHQVKRMAEETAKTVYNIYDRLQIQQTWSAPGLLMNAAEQTRELAKQNRDLDRVRAMGLSDDAIAQLGFTDPGNAQQLSRFIDEATPRQVEQINKQIAERIRQTGRLIKDESNDAWQEMQYQHKKSLDRSAEQFKITMDQQRKDHKRQMDQMLSDYDKQVKRARDQFDRTANDMTMSIKEIFRSAGDTLTGSLETQMDKIERTFGRLRAMVFRENLKTVTGVRDQWGLGPDNVDDIPGNYGGGPRTNQYTAGAGGAKNSGNSPITPIAGGTMTAEYGDKGSLWASAHTGDDYAAPMNTPIVAVLPGTVASTGWNDAYGWITKISHGMSNGKALETWYAHQNEMLVAPGDKVDKGQTIGRVGMTGNVTGPHVHFEVRVNGQAVDPDTLGQMSNGLRGGGGGGGADFSAIEKYVNSDPFLKSIYGGGVISQGLAKMARTAGVKGGDGASLLDLTQFEGGGSSAKNIALGKQMAAAFGWEGEQWKSLYALWMKESGWNHTANNPTSSAYGIPQGLVDLHGIPKPYWKKSTGSGAGAEYYGGDPATQIAWGLNYISSRYGNPSKAWDHWQANNSYGHGSIFTGAQTINVGERGPEAVLPLNDRGISFLLGLMDRFSGEARKVNTHGTSIPMSSTYNYRIDKSTTFSGDVIVHGVENPRELAEKARLAARRKKLVGGKR